MGALPEPRRNEFLRDLERIAEAAQKAWDDSCGEGE